MKKLLTIIAAVTLSLSSIAQDGLCTGKTKAGAACKNHAQAGQQFCGIHNPNATRCGAPTKSGTQCKAIVKVSGSKCHNHKSA